MLALEYVYNYHPEGIRSLILSSTNPSASLWAEEQHRMMKEMPPEMQEAILRAEETGDFSDPAYLAANDEFMFRHAANRVTESDPECLRRPKKSGKESYLYGWRPNEYVPSGSLKDFEYIDRLGEIEVPSLIMSGISDLCSPLVAKTMHDGIKESKWNSK
jgi:proline iminopeptidase